MLFGLDTFETGQLLLEGKSVRFKSTHDALAAGVALVPENRKEQGIIPQMGVGFNITISVLEQFMHLARVDHAKESRLIDHFFQALKIKAYSATSAAAISKRPSSPVGWRPNPRY